MSDPEDDPVVASYDVFLTESDISRYVFQYLDRHVDLPYNERNNQCPTQLKIKPKTGLVEVEIPISTRANYDVNKGLRFGEAVKKSRSARDGGAYGMSGGFTAGSAAAGSGGKMKVEANDVEVLDNKKAVVSNALMRTQSLAGRVKPAEEGDPVYMLATFQDSKLKGLPLPCEKCPGDQLCLSIISENLYLSPISSVVQFHPQLHHLDALDEVPKAKGRGKKDDDEPAVETEARAIDMKVKTGDDGEAAQVAGNLELLKQMQEEKWNSYGWVDAEVSFDDLPFLLIIAH